MFLKKPFLFFKNDENKAFVPILALQMHFLRYFSYKNVLKISPKLRLDVLINCVLIKKKVCIHRFLDAAMGLSQPLCKNVVKMPRES